MNIKIVFVVFVIIFCIIGGFVVISFDKGNEEETVERVIPESIKELRNQKIKLDKNITMVQLKNETLINNFPCAPGWTHFTLYGDLKAFTLAENAIIQGNLVPKYTWVQLDEELKLKYCSFPHDTKIQDYICIGGRGGSKGTSTAFYNSGKLKGFYSRTNTVIDSVSCKAGKFAPINLHENGKLKECTLSMDIKIDNKNVHKGNTIVITEEGDITISDGSLLNKMHVYSNKFLNVLK